MHISAHYPEKQSIPYSHFFEFSIKKLSMAGNQTVKNCKIEGRVSGKRPRKLYIQAKT